MEFASFKGIIDSSPLPSPKDVNVPADSNDMITEYAESAVSLLDDLERLAIEYEKNIADFELTDEVKRVLHKLKGESGVMGIEMMSELFHQTEQAFEQLNEQLRSDMLLRCRDWACDALEYIAGPQITGFQVAEHEYQDEKTGNDQEIEQLTKEPPQEKKLQKAAEVVKKAIGIETSSSTSKPSMPRNLKQLAIQKGNQLAAQNIMGTNIITVSRHTPVYEAIALMVKNNVTGLPVVNDNYSLAGIITEKDVLKLLYDMQDSSITVEQFMTQNVTAFDVSSNLNEIRRCLVENKFRRVPVLQDGKVVGVISRRDVIAFDKAAFLTRPENKQNKQKRKIFLARDIMKTSLVVAKRSTSVLEAVDLIINNNITGLPVVTEAMKLSGVITEKDMLELPYNSKINSAGVSDYMTKKVVSFEETDSLIDICDCLIANDFRRVTILDSKGKLVGIISRADIIAYIFNRRASSFIKRRKDDRG